VKPGCLDLMALAIVGAVIAAFGLVALVNLAAAWPLAAVAVVAGSVTWAVYRVNRLILRGGDTWRTKRS